MTIFANGVNPGPASDGPDTLAPVLYDQDTGNLQSGAKILFSATPQFYNGLVPSRLISYGDSISINTGVGSNTAAQMYVNLLAAKYISNATFVPTAVTGTVHAQYLNTTLTALLPQANDLFFGLPMFNTMRFMGPNPALLLEMLPDIEAFLAWMALPETAKVRFIKAGTTSLNPSVTSSGFSYFNLNGASLANLCMRGTAGATASVPAFTGCDTIYLWYARGTLSDSAFNSVFVDGQQYSISQAAPYSTFLSSFGNWTVSLLRITGLNPNVSHQITFTVPTGGAANLIAVAGFNSATVAASAPAVVTGNCLQMITGVAASGYAFAGATANDPLSQNGGIVLSAGTVTNAPFFFGHAGVEAYNRAVSRSVANLQKDGLRIALVDVASEYLTFNSAMVDADTVHPNVGGMALIASLLSQAMNPLFSGKIGLRPSI